MERALFGDERGWCFGEGIKLILSDSIFEILFLFSHLSAMLVSFGGINQL